MKNTEFERMKGHFERLCKQFGVKVPYIRPALPKDPCDFTDPEINEVRINLSQDCDRNYQIRHLFGHYLADLHAEQNGRWADDVADVIASMLEGVVLDMDLPPEAKWKP